MWHLTIITRKGIKDACTVEQNERESDNVNTTTKLHWYISKLKTLWTEQSIKEAWTAGQTWTTARLWKSNSRIRSLNRCRIRPQICCWTGSQFGSHAQIGWSDSKLNQSDQGVKTDISSWDASASKKCFVFAAWFWFSSLSYQEWFSSGLCKLAHVLSCLWYAARQISSALCAVCPMCNELCAVCEMCNTRGAMWIVQFTLCNSLCAVCDCAMCTL